MFDTGGLFAVLTLGMSLVLFFVWTMGVFAVRPKHFYRIWIGIPALGFALLVCLGLGLSFYQSLPGVVFRGSVGFDPTTDITIVNSLRHMPIDWDDTYLEFYANDSSINRIIQSEFVAIPSADIIEDTYDPPKWWTPPTGSDIQIFATNADNPQFRDKNFRWSVSHKLLIYAPSSGDPSTKLVYFRYRRH